MKIFSWNNILSYLDTGFQDPYFFEGTGISIGCFDGIHKGHRVLLETLVSNCKEKKLKSGVVTFSKPLPGIKHPQDYKGDISSLEDRIDIFKNIGLDFVIIVDFDDAFSSQLGADFLNVLINACNMELLAEGIDFRCGYKGATDVQAIKYFGNKNNIETIFVEPVYFKEGTDEEERISSSYIREMVSNGFFSTVTELLNRPYELDLSECKKDISGKKRLISRDQITQVIPPLGIYRVYDESDNEIRLEIKDKYLIFSFIEKIEDDFERIVFR